MFVFRTDAGEFLSAAKKYYFPNRHSGLTSDLQEARVFTGRGPASNAAKQANQTGKPVKVKLVLDE